MRHMFLICFLMASCWGPCEQCPEWPATQAASARRMGGEVIAECIRNHDEVDRHYCYEVGKAWCIDGGLDPNCAYAEYEFMRARDFKP